MKYIVFESTVCCPYIRTATQSDAKILKTFDNAEDAEKALNAYLKKEIKRHPQFSYYMRCIGCIDSHNYVVDYGSWVHFYGIAPMEDK